MAGVSLEIDVRDEQIRQSLDAVLRSLANPRPALAEIGELVVESVQRNFEEHRSPSGEKWAELSPRYKKWKVEKRGKNAEDILILNRILMGGIHWEVRGSSVTIGTPAEYAAIHQFGGTIHIGARTQTLAHGNKDWKFISREKASRRKTGSTRISIAHIGEHDVQMPPRPFLGVREDADWPKINAVLERYILRGRA